MWDRLRDNLESVSEKLLFHEYFSSFVGFYEFSGAKFWQSVTQYSDPKINPPPLVNDNDTSIHQQCSLNSSTNDAQATNSRFVDVALRLLFPEVIKIVASLPSVCFKNNLLGCDSVSYVATEKLFAKMRVKLGKRM